MSKEKSKKKIISAIAIPLALIILAVSIYTIMYQMMKYDADMQVRASEQNNVINYVGSTIEFMKFMEDEGIELDSDVKEKYRKVSEKIFDNIYEPGLWVYSLGDIAIMNSYFDLGKDEYIQSLFDKFYSEKYGALKDNIYDNDEYKENNPGLSQEMFVFITLKRANFDFSKYNIDEKYVEEFNIKAEKKKTFSEASDIYWYFVYTNNLDKIDYQKLRDYYIDDLEDQDDEEYTCVYDNGIYKRNFHKIVFDNDYSLMDKVKNEYLSLDSDDDFGFYGTSDELTYIYHTVGYSYIDNIKGNKYLVENVNRWLDTVYKEQVKANSKAWLGEL